MKQLTKLNNQAREILQLIAAISHFLQRESILNNAFAVRLFLSTLSIKVKAHFLSLDEELYLAYLDCEEHEARLVTKEYMEEIGEIKTAFGNYIQDWVEKITDFNDDNGFIVETNQIFAAISKGILRENDVLLSLKENTCPLECAVH
jgi:hypothetical protein